MSKKFLKYCFLTLCLLSTGFLNLLFASPRNIQFEQWCNSIEDDEIIVKFKSDNTNLQARADFQKAPNFTKQLLMSQKAKDLRQLKKHLNDIKLESLFELDNTDEEINIDPKFIARKNNFSRARAEFNLDRIYSLKVNSNQYFKSFIPKQQKKIFACQEVYRNIKKLEQDPRVEYALPNRKLKIQAEITDEYYVSNAPGWNLNYETQWGLRNINAEQAWSQTLGQRALVAVIDSGVNYNHPDLWNNIWVNPQTVKDTNLDGKRTLDDLDLNKNHKIDSNEFRANTLGFNTSSTYAVDPMDYVGHGTHVAGIIGADADGKGMVGVAPRARIMIVRVNSDSGAITESAVARAIILAARQGADVANLSMGTTSHLPIIYDAIKAVKNQMVIVAAAGNNSSFISPFSKRKTKSFYPAAYNEVISVAASTPSNKKAYFSNYGRAVDICAPGGADNRYDRNILSTDLTIDGYQRRIGTSMAAPFVTGVVALVLSTKPTASPVRVKNLLIAKAIKTGYADGTGAGVVNALSAI
jgi:subtilisin family serine protease